MFPLSSLLQSRGCGTVPSRLHVNGSTSHISSVCAFHLRPLQPLPTQYRVGGILNLPCDGRVPSAAHGNPKYAGSPSSPSRIPRKVFWLKENLIAAGFNSEAESPVVSRPNKLYWLKETLISLLVAEIPVEPNKGFVSVSEIENVASRQGLALHMETVGPFFRVRVLDLQSMEVLGAAQGFVKIWTCGRILHLDSVRLSRASHKVKKPIFGIAFLLGAAAVRHGYDLKCVKAELLAIKDTDEYHCKEKPQLCCCHPTQNEDGIESVEGTTQPMGPGTKLSFDTILVRYYSRMGFRSVYEVTGESLQDIPHMLVWGGVGTRMDANIEELLLKWSPAFKKVSK